MTSFSAQVDWMLATTSQGDYYEINFHGTKEYTLVQFLTQNQLPVAVYNLYPEEVYNVSVTAISNRVSSGLQSATVALGEYYLG